MTSKVLITGGLGFIGSFLAKRLVDRGCDVRIFDDVSRGSLEKIDGYENSMDIVEGDIRDLSAVEEAVRGIDTVFHFAAVNGTRHFYEEPDKVLEINVKGVIHALEASIAAKVQTFVFSSSSEIYYEAEHIPTPECERALIPDMTNPRFSYAGSKIIGELFCLNYGRMHNIRPIILRYHNVYGPDMGYDHVIPELFMKIETATHDFQKKSAAIDLQGSGNETRAFCFIEDAVEATLVCLENAKKNEILHIGNDEEVKIGELVRWMAEWFEIDLEVRKTPLRAGSTPRRCPDITKLRSLGFEPRVKLREGLERTLTWYREKSRQRVA